MESINIDILIENCIKILEPGFLKDSKKQALFLISQISDIPYMNLLIPGTELFTDKITAEKIYAAAHKRVKNEPLQYITGKAFFMNEEYSVGKGILIPRKDTEILVEEAFEILKKIKTPNILEFCTGSGCIIISLSIMLDNEELKYKALSTDISEDAIYYSRKNLFELNPESPIEIIKHDILLDDVNQIKEFCENYDMILCNPPYIKTNEISSLEPQVSLFEPFEALDGGIDGLDFYRRIAFLSENLLSAGGYLILEIGFNQYEDVKSILERNNIFEDIQLKRDYSGNDRVIIARRFTNEREI